ncbi:hypothetical protein [Longimicrobium sp.]|uniref:hypothetical protein n=1 Tax=Longimicrobium sp. TaxID=2029185 RepID=UPI003B3B1437
MGPVDGAGPAEGFESNVFINCPFDREYYSLLRPLLFTIVCLGFTPRIATERSDSGENRLDKIRELIRDSKYSLHDLSRLKSKKANEFYRLNMPFELGLEYGARGFGAAYMNGKRFLILEQNLHDFGKALSDLSGVDIKPHRNEPDEVVRAVRDWFVETVGLRGVETATVIWYRFGDFTTAFFEQMLALGSPERDIEEMPVAEYVDHIRDWVREYREAA